MKKLFWAFLIVLPVICSAKGPKTPAQLSVISYNIRMGEANDGTNSWTYRYSASAMMIMDQMPDIFGLQEAYDYQVNYLSEYCSGYKGVGVGRENGKHEGEHMSIFYNTKTIKLLKWGTFWLSETPDTPSMGWDAACKRTATWALLQDKASKKKFYFVNTHLDHVGVEARKNGLNLIVEKIAQINPEGYPMVLSGDFNIPQSAPELKVLDGKMKSARTTAAKTDNSITYNAWGKKESASVIDHIYYSGFSSCPVFEVVTKPYYDRNYISDHFPVKAILIF